MAFSRTAQNGLIRAFSCDVRILNYVRNDSENFAGSLCLSDSKSQTGVERPLLKAVLKTCAALKSLF